MRTIVLTDEQAQELAGLLTTTVYDYRSALDAGHIPQDEVQQLKKAIAHHNAILVLLAEAWA